MLFNRIGRVGYFGSLNKMRDHDENNYHVLITLT